MTKGKGNFKRKSKIAGRKQRRDQRFNNAPRDGWDRLRGYTAPGSLSGRK